MSSLRLRCALQPQEKRRSPEMLVLLDAGFWGDPLLKSVRMTGAQFLVNVSKTPLLHPFGTLPDGSYLSRIYTSTTDRKQNRKGTIVRAIKYQLEDPQRPGHGQTRRLVTSLWDATAHPAQTLIVLYHQRWEHELLNDEQKTHQDPRRPHKPTHLRSETPSGVVPELLGLSLAHFVIRKTMFAAAAHHDIDPDRLSFSGAFQILQTRLPECPPARRQGKYKRGIKTCWPRSPTNAPPAAEIASTPASSNADAAHGPAKNRSTPAEPNCRKPVPNPY